MNLELDERTAVPLSINALLDLLEFYQCGGEPGMSPPLCLGWDIHRHWPSAGFAIWRDLMFEYEPPLLTGELLDGDQRTAITPEQYEVALAEQWALFAREMHWTDTLIVDAMFRARHEEGWEVCGDASEATEAILDDLAARSGAKRATVQAEEDRREKRHSQLIDRYYDLDDDGYCNWLDNGEPEGRALKFKRWKERREADDKRRKQQVDMRNAAENEWLAFGGSATQRQVDAWHEKYNRTILNFERKLEPVTILPFPAAPKAPAAPALHAPQPFVWRDPRTLPMMPFIYGKHLLRGCVSLTVAPSGGGKTFEKVTETVAMVTGRMLLHDQPVETFRVWFYNGEEPMEFLEKRFQAAFLHHKITPEDIGDRLFVNDRTTKMVIAKQTREGVTIMEPVKELLISYIRDNRIDVLSIDPFISAHAVAENDNVAIDQVVKAYADVAQETNCAIDLVHHSRKTNGAAVGIEDARGASAAIGAVRAARTMNLMSPEEAKAAGIENRYRYVRIDDAKPNHAPRSDKAQWVHFQSVYLGNGPMGTAGDNIAVMVPWQWPDAMAGVTSDGLQAVWEAVRAGSWRQNVQAKEWVGKPVAGALGLDLDKPADAAKVKGMIHRWLKSGELVKVEGLDENRKEKVFVEVGVVNG